MTKEEILKAIEEMKVIELHELVEAIKEKFNVTAAMPVAAVAAAEFDVIRGSLMEFSVTSVTIALGVISFIDLLFSPLLATPSDCSIQLYKMVDLLLCSFSLNIVVRTSSASSGISNTMELHLRSK